MRDPVDDHAAGPADALSAVVIERDRFFAAFDQALIDDVEHFQKGHVGRYVIGVVHDKLPLRRRVLLSPDTQRQVHFYL